MSGERRNGGGADAATMSTSHDIMANCRSHWDSVADVSGGLTGILLRGNSWIAIRVRLETGRDAREAMLYRWYRDRLREGISEAVAKRGPKIVVTMAGSVPDA